MTSKIDTTVHQLPNEPRKRAAIYIRVSTEEQGAKETDEIQFHEVTKWAEFHPSQTAPYIINKHHIYRDIGYSGVTSVEERKALSELVEAARRGEFEVILVWKIDRLFRNNELLLRFIREMNEISVDVIAVTQPEFCTKGPIGKLLISVLGSFAEIERDQIIERTVAGKQRIARSGKWAGGQYPPYGYDIDEERKIAVNQEEAKIVRKIFDWFVNDELSTYEIQQRLHAMKVLTKADNWMQQQKKKAKGKKKTMMRKVNPPGFWSLGTIVKILKQDAYSGTYYYGKRTTKRDPATGKKHEVLKPKDKWIPIPCTPIVDKILCQKAQQRLLETKRLSRKNSKYNYLFSGKIVCSCCSSPYVGYTRKTYKGKRCASIPLSQIKQEQNTKNL